MSTPESSADGLQKLIDALALLAQSDRSEASYYQETLARLREASGAVSGAVWQQRAGSWHCRYSSGSPLAEVAHGWPAQLSALQDPCELDVSGGLPTLAAPASAAGDAPTILVLQLPAKSGSDVRDGALRLLAIAGDLASAYQREQRLRRLTAQQEWVTRCAEFCRAAHASPALLETAYTIANEGRSLIGCERLSVVTRSGQRCVVEAISGQAVVQRRSSSVRLLEALAARALATNEVVFASAGETLSPQLEAAYDAYAEETHARCVLIVPLRDATNERTVDGERDERPSSELPLGGLVAEWFAAPADAQAARERALAAARYGGTALAAALERRRIFLLPLWSALGRVKELLRGRPLLKLLTLATVLVALVLALTLVKTDFVLLAEGELQPQQRRHVFAPQDGVVTALHVRQGEATAKGGLLLALESQELDQQLEKTAGERRTAAAKVRALKRQREAYGRRADADPAIANQFAVEERELQAWIESLDKQLALLQRQRQRLQVTSPLDGIVVTWNLKKRLLDRPVRRGERLLTVANVEGPWVVELLLPGRRVGHYQRAQAQLGPQLPVQFVVLTDPGVVCRGQVREAAQSARLDPRHGHGTRLIVEIDPQSTPRLQPGASVIARIYCGKRPVGYVWLHDVWEFVQTQILFRIL